MKTIIGIDLGTTYSLVSVLQKGTPIIIKNALGEALTPSAVSVRADGEILVGAPALARAVTAPQETVVAFKRDMGTSRTYSLGRHTFTPVQLSALVLKALKADAEAALGHEVLEAVITVPAYFGDLQRQATRDAGALAGLKVERIINEPTAAALAYGLQSRNVEQKVAVLDLGGGTFDVTVLEIVEGVIEVQSTAGDARLGGEDFDDALVHLVRKRFDTINWEGDQAAVALLREAVRRARHGLSTQAEVKVALPLLTRGSAELDLQTVLTRAECEEAWAPLLSRIAAPVDRALADAKLTASKLDHVLLVGGATRMPCIPALVTRLLGKTALTSLSPDEAIALGAAVQAGLKAGDKAIEDVVVTDVAPFSLGVKTATVIRQQVLEDVFIPIIERGTTIPCSRVKSFFPMADGQTRVQVEVFQGEHSDCRRNEPIGKYLVENLPALPCHEHELAFRFTYDLNGLLELEITRVATGAKESFLIQNRQRTLTHDQLKLAQEAMAQWKVHPRELLPNTTAIERAEALYATLRGGMREELGQLILQFRAMLESQETEAITAGRAHLVEVVRRVREQR